MDRGRKKSDEGLVRRGRGFTLVEVLVVIAIIALLVSILLPVLGKARKQAEAVVCQSNLHEWGIIFALYATENDGSLPQSVSGGSLSAQKAYWIMSLEPYYEDKKIRLCPSAAKSLNPPACNRCPGTTFSAWGPFDAATEEDWWDTGAMGSYGINEWCANPPKDSYWSHPSEYAWRTSGTKGAGQIPVFLDCVYVGGYPIHDDEPPEFPSDPWRGWAWDAMKIFCLDRHMGGTNGVFMDKSVRKVGLKELWTLKWHRQYDTCGLWTKCGGVQPDEWPLWMRRFKDY